MIACMPSTHATRFRKGHTRDSQAILAIAVSGSAAEVPDVSTPKRMEVMPVFFLPRGETAPTRDQKLRLAKHLKMCQDRYREMLGGRDTFRIAQAMPDVYRAKHPLAFYKQLPMDGGYGGAGLHFVGELLEHFKVNRFNCPYVFAIIVMNPEGEFPHPAGGPINGGFSRGAGEAHTASYALDKVPYFQGRLQHELGHAFGLAHPDQYGYDQKSSLSIMSYNSSPASPLTLFPEDIRALALNKPCFGTLRFDPAIDVRPGQTLCPRFAPYLAPMIIPGQLRYEIQVSTPSGESFGTHASNIVLNVIKPSKGPGNTFDNKTMWHSEKSATDWVSLDLTFPVPVTLMTIGIYTEHSGQYNRANRARIQVKEGTEMRDILESDIATADATVKIPETSGQAWRIHLRAGPSTSVTVRGLRFASPSGEIFPPLLPYTGD